MKIILTFCFIFLTSIGIFAQEGFQFTTSKSRVKLPFKLVNNLIILPIKVNGIELNFLVDTGVEETILFSLDDKKEVPLYNVEKIKLIGLGTQKPIEGLKAFKNTLSVSGLEYKNQEIVIVLDQEFNFSSTLGIEVNGIIGYHFFSHNIVKIDYNKKKIFLYNPQKWKKDKILSKFEAVPFTLEKAKPYTTMQVELGNEFFDAKCLIDSGNSDGLWLFESESKSIIVPKRNFDDYLGRGFSGDVYGKKGKVSTLVLKNYQFDDVIAAFPDSLSLNNLRMVDNRVGSIGGEVLKRFNVIFDYQNEMMYLKKNKYYKEKFRYNTTGITIHHAGLQWYKEEIPITAFEVGHEGHYMDGNLKQLKYNFKLSPIYEILTIRKNSPAEKAGLKIGDVIIKINDNRVYRMNLDKINRLLCADDQEELILVVARNGMEITYKFKVFDLL